MITLFFMMIAMLFVGAMICDAQKHSCCYDGPCVSTLDCDICGCEITCQEEDGTWQPDKDVICDECGASYILNVDEDSEDVWLNLNQTGYERVVELEKTIRKFANK
jgi:hypothetical protein